MKTKSLFSYSCPFVTFVATLLFVSVSVGSAAEDAKNPYETGTPQRIVAADYQKKRMAILSPDGKVEWERKINDCHDLHVLPNGDLLYQTTWTNLVEMTPDGKEVWHYDAAKMNGNTGKPVEVHAFQRLADGVTMIAESGPSRIIEVDRDGKLLKQIPLKVSKSDPHRDTRLVRKLDNGHYLVAHEGEGAVREYDGDGNVVWDYPVPMFGRNPADGHGPEAFGNAAFSAVRLPNGNTLIATGNGHAVL